MGAQFSGPFFSHTEGYAPGQMADALAHLDATVEQLGPFDGVVGFSQGAALAVSYMHDQATRHGHAPFRFAVLFSTVCAFAADPEASLDAIRGLCRAGRGLDAAAGDGLLNARERALHDALAKVIRPLRESQALLPDIDLAVYTVGSGCDAPRLLLPELLAQKLRVPTVHMHGKRDARFMRDMSLTARGLFDEKLAKTLEHGGSHHPPQKDAEVRAALRAMEWAVGQAERLAASSRGA